VACVVDRHRFDADPRPEPNPGFTHVINVIVFNIFDKILKFSGKMYRLFIFTFG
jgi:hypothetical protein